MQYYIISWRQIYYFQKIKNRKFWAKRRFRSQILGKTPVWTERFLASGETRFLFFNYFQILHAGSNTIEELSNSFILINDLKFLLNGDLVPPLIPNFVSNLQSSPDFDFYETSLFGFQLKIKTKFKVFTNGVCIFYLWI